MREPRYRAWDRQNEKMYAVTSIEFTGTGVRCVRILGNREVPKSTQYVRKSQHIYAPHFDLMEYVGKLDRNGVKICEGDIVQTDEQYLYTVIWNEEETGFWLKPLGAIGKNSGVDWGDLTVISNQFEYKGQVL